MTKLEKRRLRGDIVIRTRSIIKHTVMYLKESDPALRLYRKEMLAKEELKRDELLRKLIGA